VATVVTELQGEYAVQAINFRRLEADADTRRNKTAAVAQRQAARSACMSG